MLSEYRKYYEQIASQVPTWTKMSKSELCLNYVNYKKECYLAGLIAKYLKKAEIDYNSQYYKTIIEGGLNPYVPVSVTRYDDAQPNLEFMKANQVLENPKGYK